MGWGAYVATGARNLLGARFATRLRIDGGDPIAHTARTIVVGNCGRLTGGITLMPDAEVDDGILDVVAVTPKGIVGWAGVAVHVLAKRGRNHPKLDRYRCQSILVSLDAPQMVEIDGDVIGEARRVRFEVRPKSLIVRTPPVTAADDLGRYV
jgi:diacylglycerol kinase family enzyme